MANSHKGNDGAWKEDKNIADATMGSIETMASEFWRVSGQDSSFVHQLENAKRELDDTVISEKENVRTVKQNAEQNQAVDTAQGNINMANQNPEKFLNTYHDEDKSHKIFIKKAVEKGLINYSNDTFRHGKVAIGTNEQRVIEWLLDNKDIYAVMKLEVSGQTIKNETKKEKV